MQPGSKLGLVALKPAPRIGPQAGPRIPAPSPLAGEGWGEGVGERGRGAGAGTVTAPEWRSVSGLYPLKSGSTVVLAAMIIMILLLPS